MATPADAEIILKLYDLRREESMRVGRRFVGVEFNPQTVEEFSKIHQSTHPQNVCWRQVISYWEMASALAAQGGVDVELYSTTNSEPFFLRAKYAEMSQAASGNVFMPQTLKVMQMCETAQKRFDGVVKMLADRKAAAAAK